jgi:ERF superfamily
MEKLKQTELVAVDEPSAIQPANTMYEMIARMVRDPTIDPARIAQFMELQERAESRQAEKDFVSAFARLKFPPIKKSAKGHNSKYAAYEEIQAIIDPILASEGFTLTFSSGEITPQGIPIHGLLSHIGGHSRPGMLYLPRDKSGSMNDIQGMGSTTSYGQRYLSKMMLSLRFIGDDDDGVASSAITDQQQMNIEDLIAECALSPAARSKFLEMMGVKALADIQQGAYRVAINFLMAKRRTIGEKV